MLSVGQRVKEAIDYMGTGQVVSALTPTCIALDITAQRVAGAKRSGRKIFKDFIQKSMWLITLIGFPGLMSSEVRVPFHHPEIPPNSTGTVGIDEIVYHVLRCGSVHSDEKNSKITWNKNISLGIDHNTGNLVLHEQLVWGLLAAVIFMPENKDEQIPDTYWISIWGFKNFVTEFWGRIDLAKRIAKEVTGITIQ
jgi:hypothetical protein